MHGSSLIAVDLSGLHAQSAEFVKKEGIEIVPLELELDYDHWQADEILSAILPEALIAESPAGFTMVGHIAHMNLRDEYLPYKNIIGQVILDKNSAIRTVVNKLDTIDSVYRNFQMEVLAGEQNFVAEQHESGCRFRFDFSKVYWNSRLHTEHERLVSLFQEGDAVCDVMAGVGPFAIPAAKKKVLVFANDLNPASFEALSDNIKLNKVSDFVIASNLDGREYIRTSINHLQKKAETDVSITVASRHPPKKKIKSDSGGLSRGQHTIRIPQVFQHYVMNLPATAIEFLDAFCGLYATRDTSLALPMIHVHCFTKFEDEAAQEDLTERIGNALNYDMKSDQIEFHHVRRVAPSKDMFCCSFRLPSQVAFENKSLI